MKQHRLRALLRQVRLDAGLKQAQLAELMGQSQSFVSKYESGERRLDLLELHQICEAVGITLAQFVDRFEGSPDETKRIFPKAAKTLLGKRKNHK